jgi:DNA invertase Pin-like site-specific DNA recombinase
VNRLAVAYTRVSTEEQAAFGGSLAMQADRLAMYCKLQGLELVETFSEQGVSGSVPLGERRRGKVMLARVTSGEVGHVVALKLDRLFRDAANALTQTRDWDKAGVELHLVDMGGQSLNTSSAMGRLMLTVLAGLAEMERNLIGERTRAVLSHKRAKHQVYSPTPLGFRREGKQLVADDGEQAVLARIRAMSAEGMSLNRIAATLNNEGVPTKNGKRYWASTIRYILGNHQLHGKRAA